ncbi:hydroxy-delta-5-steroid dehydrogenase, 3 beta- and steroid delta-isomerase 1 [Latimeria chalumnae]|uniref:Hydroxy-delta-5-steroid dehydrogenase, 3 beta- and steroid delta-isomerase 1 n=1 Tax=Latimeria chalumnae TaxID=7897 RepID=H3B588_LATCH|nr:PREDICTED: 3 beta-hydroxysteroid dehydrogenase/Delta 5-->4-isomerase-like [Latimeria chalumnae]|eukprot:XP_006000122.1 PREDICTED: 3 beta-hydroxysteroid dehydrogenase/Delta 5--_4-isomerase-like [Latimeria chalumnae]
MSLAGLTCLITGASGFLGRRIVQQLLEEEEELLEIRLLDIVISQELLTLMEEFQGKTLLKVCEGDIRDMNFLRTSCQGVTLVIHTASLIDVQGILDEEELKSVNVTGTQLLLRACVLERVKFVIYTSSVEVLGPNSKGEPIRDGNEDTPYVSTLKFLYSKTKQQAEENVLASNGRALENGERMVTCALRPTFLYGEGCRFLLSHADNAIKNGDVLLRTSQKEAVVNPVYVGNGAWAHLLLAKAMLDPVKAARVGGRFYFISDDTPHVSYSDLNHEVAGPLGFGIQTKLAMPLPFFYFMVTLLELVQSILKPFIRYVPKMNKQLLTMLNTSFTLSYQQAHRDFGYTPRYKWEEGKQRTTNWLASILPQRRELLQNYKQ